MSYTLLLEKKHVIVWVTENHLKIQFYQFTPKDFCKSIYEQDLYKYLASKALNRDNENGVLKTKPVDSSFIKIGNTSEKYICTRLSTYSCKQKI